MYRLFQTDGNWEGVTTTLCKALLPGVGENWQQGPMHNKHGQLLFVRMFSVALGDSSRRAVDTHSQFPSKCETTFTLVYHHNTHLTHNTHSLYALLPCFFF